MEDWFRTGQRRLLADGRRRRCIAREREEENERLERDARRCDAYHCRFGRYVFFLREEGRSFDSDGMPNCVCVYAFYSDRNADVYAWRVD